MKNMFLIALLTLGALTASATEDATILDPQYIRHLQPIKVLSVEVDPGPHMAAVQPSAFLNFEYSSCREFSFTPKLEENSGILFVAVETDIHTMECMGPRLKRQYKLQISSDFQNRVVVLNPVPELIRK
jgi:hypothetical protein